MRRVGTAIRGRFLRFRREILVVGYAVRSGDTPLRWRLAGTLLILYLLSPVDLIPVVVPVLGVLDDLIIVPLGLSLVVGRLPEEVRREGEASAARIIHRWVARPLRFLVVLVTILLVSWSLILALVWWLLVR
ncbi:MAG: DUF1232 domain-containing protein [Gemmatimonadales bacterium]|nr:MAG: DUF1232 domain-containing protein [Gemmatimonadales bacterium]